MPRNPLLWGLVCRNFMPLLKLFVYSYISTFYIRIFVLASRLHSLGISTRWTFLIRLSQLSSTNKDEISTLVDPGTATGIYGIQKYKYPLHIIVGKPQTFRNKYYIKRNISTKNCEKIYDR